MWYIYIYIYILMVPIVIFIIYDNKVVRDFGPISDNIYLLL